MKTKETEGLIFKALKNELIANKAFINSVGNSTRALKTISIQSALIKLGKKLGYSVYTRYNNRLLSNLRNKLGTLVDSKLIKDAGPHWNTEWLSDLCWAKHDGDPSEWKNFEYLEFVCESELETSPLKRADAILEDFQKLTVIDANFRLIIFQYLDSDFEAYTMIDQLKQHCPKHKNFKYLAMSFPMDIDEKKTFVHTSWIC